MNLHSFENWFAAGFVSYCKIVMFFVRNDKKTPLAHYS
jgi:hypothetical protein